ncbi:helix-turn-helix domain-containing protein [Klebsiella pneumoniae]|nr:helix-turn-helix domain-containing protein [Klebsiella pneumoniae]
MQHHENLTQREAAAYLRHSERSLIRWRNARIGPPWVKAGGRVLYRRTDLDWWLERQTVEPVAEVG